MGDWTIEAFCSSQDQPHWDLLAETSVTFLKNLNLSFIHPFCEDGAAGRFDIPGIPAMGPLMQPAHETFSEWVVTLWFSYVPVYLAMLSLWFRLVSSVVAPLGVLSLFYKQNRNPPLKIAYEDLVLSLQCIFTVLCSIVIMTDSLYVLQFGPGYGIALTVASLVLALRACHRRRLLRTAGIVVIAVLVGINLSWDYETSTFQFGGADEAIRIHEGLYYDQGNEFIARVVQSWPRDTWDYSEETGATRWMITGDARTGLPFFLNSIRDLPWTRVWMPTEDQESLALDIAFPVAGHDSSKPVYLVLHGLNGGSREEYVKDLAWRRTDEGSTVVVMIARGLMDTPLRGWNLFNGARTSDVHSAAQTIRRALAPLQLLVGVGYSMGAIVLNNYCATSGVDNALDAAVSISGALDCRHEIPFWRSRRLWQPMLASFMRENFVMGKWSERVKARLSRDDFVAMMRASDNTALDTYVMAAYNKESFNNVTHYYSEMSALGDIPLEVSSREAFAVGKISNLTVPLCVLHAIDDPISTWRTIVANEGLMRPDNLVRAANGNLVLVLTRSGGHVGWPMGWMPFQSKWKYMSEVVAGFVYAVDRAKTKAVS